MPASTRKDHVFVIGILRAPEHVSQTEFETQIAALVDVFLALPVTQRCVLRWDTMRRTDSYDERVKPLGFAGSESTIVFRGEYETYYHMIELFEDAEVQNFFAGAAAHAVQPPSAYAFLADVTTPLEDLSRESNVHTTAIFKAPADLSKEEFYIRMQNLIASLTALPATRKALVRLEVCVQTEATDVQSLGFSAPEPTIVMHADGENWKTMLEFTRDADVQKLLAESGQKISFHQDSVWFSTEIDTKLDNSGGRA